MDPSRQRLVQVAVAFGRALVEGTTEERIKAAMGFSHNTSGFDADVMFEIHRQLSEPEPAAEPAPDSSTWSVNVRAARHLTKTVDVIAHGPGEASARALVLAAKPDFVWDESDPYDLVAESFN